MKERTHPLAVTAVVIVLLLFDAHAAESLSVLLQKGIYAEETEGNLDAAIKIYEGIIKEAEANRSLVAQAQYRLGMCYHKKGKKEDAVLAFQTLVDSFPNESELIAKTKDRLSELGQPVLVTVARKIWANAEDLEWGARVSPDGQLLAFTDWKTGDLAVRDLRTGQNQRLTHNKSLEDGLAWYPVFSPDGKQIAYAFSVGRENQELRILTIQNPEPRVVLKRTAPCFPADWSPNGAEIVALLRGPDKRESSLALIGVSDGAIRTLLAVSNRIPSDVRFTPDGHSLVYSRKPSDETEGQDLFLLHIADAQESALIQHPANDALFDWAPGGQTVLFTSDRRGTKDLWSIQVDSGKAKGEPKLIKPNLGSVTPLGVSRSGALFYGISSGGDGMYRAELDFQTGKILSSPQPIPRQASSSVIRLALSPNGRYLAYYVPQRTDFYWPKLMILDLATGKHRESYAGFSNRWLSPPKWLPDNRTLFQRITGTSREHRVEMHLIDTHTDTATTLAIDDSVPMNFSQWTVAFDLQTLAHVRWSASRQAFVVVRRDLKTGQEREAVLIEKPGSDETYAFQFSPDLKSLYYSVNPQSASVEHPAIAFRYHFEADRRQEFIRWTNSFELFPSPDSTQIALVGRAKKNGSLFKLLTLDNDQPREQWTTTITGRCDLDPGWTADGRYFVCRKESPEAGEGKRQLLAISAQTGQLHPSGLSVSWVAGATYVHPDGKQVFFAASEPSVREAWVMENFLPQVAAK
ncbi:MAG: PD40 domain-containing protein [Verrucomicrobia bacterium]|nr:PD40 domain-containing protein [Verrucomicrobiota bacterium]